MKRLVLLALVGVFALPLAAGCMTNRPVFYSWPHNKRRINRIVHGFHELHMDIDRVIFDMDERPLEDVD